MESGFLQELQNKYEHLLGPAECIEEGFTSKSFLLLFTNLRLIYIQTPAQGNGKIAYDFIVYHTITRIHIETHKHAGLKASFKAWCMANPVPFMAAQFNTHDNVYEVLSLFSKYCFTQIS